MGDIRIAVCDCLPEESRRIREEVFVFEQGFSAEFDGDDVRAKHVLLYVSEEAAATARVIFSEEGSCTVGRVAVKKRFRGEGLGKALVTACERVAREGGAKEIFVRAQTRAVGFYASCGFALLGQRSYEDGVAHVLMKKEI